MHDQGTNGAHPHMLRVVVSPYHLCTREAPAMLGLLLGDRVATLLPKPIAGAGREHVFEAVERAPRYLRLLDSWRWTRALWRSGIVSDRFDGHDASLALEEAHEVTHARAGSSRLGVILSQQSFSDHHEYLDALSRDMLRGGPDPSMNIPVNTALDLFALRHGALVLRSGGTSLAQRTESKLAQRLATFAIPLVTDCSARHILRIRSELHEELVALRRALARTAAGDHQSLDDASRRYTDAFESHAHELGAGDDDEGVRVRWAWVQVSLVGLPENAVLLAAQSALGIVRNGRARSPAQAPGAGPGVGAGETVSLVVRAMRATPA